MTTRVEADETYIGGRASNRRKGRRTRKVKRTRPGARNGNKSIILGVKDRATKKARAKVVAEAHRHNVTELVEANTAETFHVYQTKVRSISVWTAHTAR